MTVAAGCGKTLLSFRGGPSRPSPEPIDALGLRVGAASCGALLGAAMFDGRDTVRLGAVYAWRSARKGYIQSRKKRTYGKSGPSIASPAVFHSGNPSSSRRAR